MEALIDNALPLVVPIYLLVVIGYLLYKLSRVRKSASPHDVKVSTDYADTYAMDSSVAWAGAVEPGPHRGNELPARIRRRLHSTS